MKQIIIAIILCISSSVQAGGWIHQSTSDTTAFDYNEPPTIDIVVEVTEDEIKITYQATFDINTSDFVWLIPVYSNLVRIETNNVDWGWQTHFSNPDPNTHHDGVLPRQFITPDNPCNAIMLANYPYNLHSWGEAISEGLLQDYWLANSSNQIHTYLEENNYPTNNRMMLLLSEYEANNIPLAVVEMIANGENTGFTSPTTFVFENTDDRIHIATRMLAASSPPETEIRLWILDDTTYAPTNYDVATFDPAEIRSLNRAVTAIRDNDLPYYQAHNYPEWRTQLFSTLEHDTLLLEYAEENIIDHDDYAQYPKLTRYFGITGNPQNDLVLIPDSSIPAISQQVTVTDHVDPITFYGCSTERAYREFLDAGHAEYLPTERIRIQDFSIPIPDGWVLSEGEVMIESRTRFFRILAPETINIASTVSISRTNHHDRYEIDSDLPMIVITHDLLYASEFRPMLRNDSQLQTFRWYPHADGGGLRFAIHAPEAILGENMNMYRAILAYIDAMPYLQSDNLPYTLLLNDRISIGYDETWEAITHIDGSARLQARNGDDVFVRMNPLQISTEGATSYDDFIERRTMLIRTIQEQYQLDETNTEAIIIGLIENSDCPSSTPTPSYLLVPFEIDERAGYLYFYLSRGSDHYLEASADHDLAEEYDLQLETIVLASEFSVSNECG